MRQSKLDLPRISISCIPKLSRYRYLSDNILDAEYNMGLLQVLQRGITVGEVAGMISGAASISET
jgi:hypothetical protein